MRDLKETADKALHNIPGNYDLTFNELVQLLNEAATGADGRCEAIYTAFRYGFVLGNRATVSGRIPKKL